jgi:hypothetical protein
MVTARITKPVSNTAFFITMSGGYLTGSRFLWEGGVKINRSGMSMPVVRPLLHLILNEDEEQIVVEYWS